MAGLSKLKFFLLSLVFEKGWFKLSISCLNSNCTFTASNFQSESDP